VFASVVFPPGIRAAEAQSAPKYMGVASCGASNCHGSPQPKSQGAKLNENLVWRQDRKSTRLNSSHLVISYAVFCLKKKKKHRSRSMLSTMTPPVSSRLLTLHPPNTFPLFPSRCSLPFHLTLPSFCTSSPTLCFSSH